MDIIVSAKRNQEEVVECIFSNEVTVDSAIADACRQVAKGIADRKKIAVSVIIEQFRFSAKVKERSLVTDKSIFANG